MLTFKNFDGKKVKAIAIGGFCAEDNELLKKTLARKYSKTPEEEEKGFKVAGKFIQKPWLQRERIGIFRLYGNNYFIENISGSIPDAKLPRRSFYPTTHLKIVDDKTLELTVSKNQKIIYTIET